MGSEDDGETRREIFGVQKKNEITMDLRENVFLYSVGGDCCIILKTHRVQTFNKLPEWNSIFYSSSKTKQFLS